RLRHRGGGRRTARHPLGGQKRLADRSCGDDGGTVGLVDPEFLVGDLLILLFSVEWGLLPASGFVSPSENLARNLATLVMPAFVLGNALAAGLMRQTRSAMLGVLSA